MNKMLVHMIEALRHCRSREDYVAVMARCRLDAQDLTDFQRYGDDGYQRNQIDVTENHELVLICWRDGQHTPIHNHAASQCCVRVLEGMIAEQRYVRGRSAGQAVPVGELRHLSPRARIGFDSPEDFHQLTGRDPSGSMSLHLYVPPLQDCETLQAP